MDTHITHLEPEPLVHRSARLPDEPDLDQAPQPSDDPAVASVPRTSGSAPARKRKRGLLTGVSLGALVVLGSGAFLLSPLNTIVPVPPSVTALAGQTVQSFAGLPPSITDLAGKANHAFASMLPGTSEPVAEPGATSTNTDDKPSQKPLVSAQREPIVAPAASLAATHVQRRPDSIITPAYSTPRREQSLNELLKLHSETDSAAADAKQPSSPGGPTLASVKPGVIEPSRPATSPQSSNDAQEPGTSPSEAVNAAKSQQADITLAVTQAALGQATEKVAEPAQAAPIPVVTVRPTVTASVPPADISPAAAVTQAVAIPDAKSDTAPAKAPILVLSVPTGHQEQAEVLQYVTGLSGEIARLRTENETLRKDITRRIADQDGRMADFNRRVSVAEARAALRSAADAGKGDTAQAETVTKVAAVAVVTPIGQVTPPRTLQPAAARPRYHVQAASPGLALLAEVGRGGGEGAQLQVAVGDQVPGYGVVKSVAQRGPNWVVQTEHGPID